MISARLRAEDSRRSTSGTNVLSALSAKAVSYLELSCIEVEKPFASLSDPGALRVQADNIIFAGPGEDFHNTACCHSLNTRSCLPISQPEFAWWRIVFFAYD